MKKIKNLFILVVISFFIVSCSSSDKELLSMLPMETAAVVGIDVVSLIDKSGITFNDGKMVFPKGFEGMNDTGKMTDSIISIVSNCGIDFSAKAYLFYLASNNCGGVMFKIKGENAILDLCEKNKLTSNIVKEVNFSHVKVDGKIVSWSDATLLIIEDASGKSKNDKILETINIIFDDKKVSFDKNVDAVNFLTKSNDLVGYINVRTAIAKLSEGNQLMKTINLNDLDGALLFNGDFNKDDIAVVCNYVGGKNNNAFDVAKKISTNPSDDFLKLFPNNVDIVYSFRLNGSELIQVKEVSSAIEMLPAKTYGIAKEDLKKIITDINGSVSIAISNISDNPLGNQYYCSIESKDSQFLHKTLKSIASKYGINGANNGGETIYSLGKISIATGVKDGYFYCNVNNNTFDNTAYSNNVLKDLYSQSLFGTYINVQDGGIAKQIMASGEAFTMYGYFTLSLKEDWSYETKYVLTDNKFKNSLQALMNQLYQLYQKNRKNIIEDEDFKMDQIDEMTAID